MPAVPPAAASGPTVSEDGERAPPGYHFEVQRRRSLLITGPILLAGGYFIGAGGALLDNAYRNDSNHFLYLIPIAGPAIARLVFLSKPTTAYFATFELLYTVALTALQVTGLTLTLVGLKSHEVLVPDGGPNAPQDRERDQNRDSRAPPVQWSLAPIAPGSLLGVSLLITN